MDRRELLALCGSGMAGFAGCVGGRPDRRPTTVDQGTSPPPDRNGSTPPTTADAELSVALDALQPALVELNVDYLRLYSEADVQYLYLDLSVTAGPPPSPGNLSFRFDGDRYPPMPSDGGPVLFRTLGSSGDGRYDGEGDDGGSGWVLFEFPETGDASESALAWPGGEWRPGERLRQRLSAPMPSLTLATWSVEETVALGDTTQFGFTVRNEGDHAGQFVAGINAEGWAPHRPVRRVSRLISPGERTSWEVEGEAVELVDEQMADMVGDGEPDIDYTLVWPGGDPSQSVRVVDA